MAIMSSSGHIERVPPHGAIVRDINCLQRDLELVAFLHVMPGHDICSRASRGRPARGPGWRRCICWSWQKAGWTMSARSSGRWRFRRAMRDAENRRPCRGPCSGKEELQPWWDWPTLTVGAARCRSCQKTTAPMATARTAISASIFPYERRFRLEAAAVAIVRAYRACRLELDGPAVVACRRFACRRRRANRPPVSVSRFRRFRSLAHLRGMLIAQLAVFFQRLVDDVFELCGNVGIQANRGRRPESRMALKIRAEVSPRNGQRAGRHLVEHRAEGEQIGAGVEFLAFRLLRRHISHRAHHGARDW